MQGGAYLRKLQYCFYWSNCFTLLKLCHVCLYILLGKVSTLLEWADELLCLWSHAVACLWQCFYTTSGTPLWIFFENSSDLLASLIEAIYLFLVRMSTSLQETTKLDFLLVKKKQHQIEQYILNYDINWRWTQYTIHTLSFLNIFPHQSMSPYLREQKSNKLLYILLLSPTKLNIFTLSLSWWTLLALL